MAFGPTFTLKPRRSAEHVRPVTATLVRIVLLAVLAVGGSAWGIYLYYTHAFRVKPHAAASSSPHEIEVELVPSSSAR